MIAFIITTVICFITYLLLTTGSGTEFLGLWSFYELLFGAILSIIVGIIARKIDVAYRVITGKINPGIVKISPDLKTDLGITMLANSITLTPGTLTVDIDENKNDLYIHWINVKKEALTKKPVDCKHICGSFEKWIRRIAE